MNQTECSKCKTQCLDLGFSLVCPECGVEIKKGLDPSVGFHNWHDSSLLYTHYSRLNRFIKLIDAVVLPNTSKKDERMLEYLFNHKDEITSDETLMSLMQTSKLQNKRYNNLHIFQKIFTPDYKPPTVPPTYFHFKQVLIKRFKDLEFAHKKLNMQQFFNYSWLLRYFLQDLPEYEPYMKYIKKIKCPKRCIFYKDLMKKLIAVI